MFLKLSKITILLLLPFWILIQERFQYSSEKIVEHVVKVHHPGKGQDNIENQVLFEIQNKKGFPNEFYMDVESVICFENVCKIVTVRLYWNTIGVYQRYELAEGVTLEKYENDLFNAVDYKKLQSILTNNNSPFKTVDANEILTVVDEIHNDLDAVSGATALELAEEDTVQGAALTCFTLWHWANGNIISVIQDITGTRINEKQLKSYINSIDLEYKIVALEQANKTNLYTNSLLKEIIKQTLKMPILSNKTFEYLENAPSKMYIKSIKELFNNGTDKLRLQCLHSVLNYNQQLPLSFYSNLFKNIAEFTSFQELSIAIRILESKKISSSKIIDNMFLLLDNKQIIFSRSAYWFLLEKEINTIQKEKLKEYQIKNSELL